MTLRLPDTSSSSANLMNGTSFDNRSKLNGGSINTNYENHKNNEYTCPICFDIIKEAYITKCGHTFCYQCIIKSVNRYNRCPKCCLELTKDYLFPNLLLDELITKYKQRTELQENIFSHLNETGTNADNLRKILTHETQNLILPDVNVILEILNQRKQVLEAESNLAQNQLLLEFLKELLKQKEEQKLKIIKELDIVKQDLQIVENTLTTNLSIIDTEIPINSMLDLSNKSNAMIIDDMNDINAVSTTKPTTNMSFQLRKRRMFTHFNDFVTSYFTTRSQDRHYDIVNVQNSLFGDDLTDHLNDTNVHQRNGLNVFRENLVNFSRYSALQSLATIYYSNDLHASSTIVSTIVFDKDNEFFAIGGVTKRIKIYDYLTVIKDSVDIHYPSVEMISGSKISCLAWNAHHKNILASSDYDGAVNIWDITTGQRTKSFHEHEKRCWSVDFNEVESRLIVSGSDDSRVKLWSIKDEHSIGTLEAKANVCCVKFNPSSSCHLSFGSADHDVHYYDLRNMKKPVCVFKGHKKAVSYVKFVNSHEIISASTDSQLKLWDVNLPPHSLRSFTGHINEKNFVGLATDRNYVACGSEDNSLYLYYKGLSKQLFNHKIDVNFRASDLERSNDLNEFVSAVCWRKNCDVILAANSRGIIKVLELV